jgi:hypothetical protein
LGLRGCRRVTNISCLVQLSTISHLDISSINFGAIGGFHLAGIIKDMGALTKLTFGDTHVVTMTTKMTEANFSGKLKSYEAQIVAAFLHKCT